MMDKKELHETIRNVIKEVEVEKANEKRNKTIAELEVQYKFFSVAFIILSTITIIRWVWLTTNNQMDFENKFNLIMMSIGAFLCILVSLMSKATLWVEIKQHKMKS